MDTLVVNDMWELVDCPKNVKDFDNCWVLRTKLDADGLTKWLRAWLVTKRHVQKARIDYDENFIPVASYDIVRAVLAVAALERLQLHQFDVKTAFLYGTLQEQVYICQPEGFNDGSGRVCKLKWSLYGVMQAPRCWNQQFVDSVKKQRLKVGTADPCLFMRQRNGKKLTVAIYVDDALILGSKESEIDVFIDELHRNFKITTGTLSSFLGMQIE